MSDTPAVSPVTATATVPDAITQPETAVNTRVDVALGEFEADMIEFVQSSFRHAAEALPLLTGELGDGLDALLKRARALAAKHGFLL
jgi:hypothetical protein